MYSEKVMDHFNNPRNVGEIENPSGVGTVGNAKCGDIMRMYLDIDENGVIQEAKFKTFGCGAAVATSSMATELVKTYQEKYGNCPAVLVGDLNAGYYAQALRWALEEGGWQHAHDVAVEYRHEGKGFNGCGVHPGVWQDEPFEKALDHILVRDIPEGAVRRFDRYCAEDYVYLSDHAPVYIDLKL